MGDGFKAQVISADQGWPLPWYWRNLPRVGYQAQVPETLDAPVVVMEADYLEAALPKMLDQGYDQGTQFGLRPGVMLIMFVKKVAEPPPPPAGVAPATTDAVTPLANDAQTPKEPPPTLSMPPAAFSPTLPSLPPTGAVPQLPTARP